MNNENKIHRVCRQAGKSFNKKLLFSFIAISFFCFGFLAEVKAEDLQCCYGEVAQTVEGHSGSYTTTNYEEFCVLITEKSLCKDGKMTDFSGGYSTYKNTKQGSCLEGNPQCLKILDNKKVRFNLIEEEDEITLEVGDEKKIGIRPTVDPSSDSMQTKFNLYVKDNDSLVKADLNSNSTFLKTDFILDSFVSVDNSRTFYTVIDTKELIKSKNIKTLPYNFSLIFFGEQQITPTGYGVKEIKITVKGIDCGEKYNNSSDCNNNPFCIWSNGKNSCYSNLEQSTCQYLNQNECNQVSICKYDEVNKKCKTVVETAIEDAYGSKKPEGYEGFLNECAFQGNCSDVNEFLKLGLNAVRWLFGIIGGLALVMFVYGGILMIISFGNEDKIKQGKNAIIASVIGMVIAFGAYLLIKFILDSIGVSGNFNIL
ncbi:MAG: pilin [Patescibacteria group bacterium]